MVVLVWASLPGITLVSRHLKAPPLFRLVAALTLLIDPLKQRTSVPPPLGGFSVNLTVCNRDLYLNNEAAILSRLPYLCETLPHVKMLQYKIAKSMVVVGDKLSSNHRLLLSSLFGWATCL